MNTVKLHGDRDAVAGAFGAIKWVAILIIIIVVVLMAWKLKTGLDDWKGDNCSANLSFSECLAENAGATATNVASGAIVGIISGLGSGLGRIGRSLFGFGKDIGDTTWGWTH